MNFPTLTTQRLQLQQILPEDQSFIFEGLSHPDVIPYYGVRYHSFEATRAQMDWYNNMLADGSGISWKIVDGHTKEAYGVISVYYYKPEHSKAEVGFWLLPSSWNKGIASEALQAVCRYWKDVKALHRMEAFVEEGNTASSRLLEKNGFTQEGLMKDCEKKEGRFISLLIYAKLFS